MATREDIIKTPEYWLEEIQGEVYRLLKDYMDANNLNQKEISYKLGFSQSYISQILNGNFNFTISKLIELSLAVGRVPELRFTVVDDYLKDESTPKLTYHYTHITNSDGGSLVHIPPSSSYKPKDFSGMITFNQ